ncbi:response regulator transcription factor [Pseudochrobactrum asaccharolyticum]|jgi:two-component system response regulator DctR|uniref:Flagellar transcriptional regulator FtcR n=1 Tax=Pseudochrobactrum asaccharolyticum TaxID=354351 RepID=A0A366DU20_9HYPH|nr:response regulator [Pseudochrobactrum asaccharolyticum]MBX8801251.1 response regulator transcription factor [Ochrobactrum sp. MR28]MBX8816584.1 response regulator transcription factor [Ochrobactrum sp. MR31]RBO92989.1 LuxR family two component transcriptional regulator [Pseudochrobactrum asaccharolyticum]
MTVHIVDDDEAIRDSLSWLFRSRGVGVVTWPSGEDFLKDWTPDLQGCILLDMRMDGMSGLEVFDRLISLQARQPVIFLTGHGDIPLAVECLKQGAADFLEKPFNDNNLVDRVLDALHKAKERAASDRQRDELRRKRAQLSPRENEVLSMILEGLLNKQIADKLDITVRTIEVHRAHIMEKMDARNAVELARLISFTEQN